MAKTSAEGAASSKGGAASVAPSALNFLARSPIPASRPGLFTKFTNGLLLRNSVLVEEDLWVDSHTGKFLDRQSAFYGEHLGKVKDAVQPGRRITTLRHKELDMSVATAFMSP